MKPYQERVLEEKKALDEKFEKLKTFISGGDFMALDPHERDRLFRQEQAMHDYSKVLGERIAAFGGDGVAGDRSLEAERD